MAITRVNFVESNQWNAITSTTLATSAINITAGNTIVANVGADAATGQTVVSVTDTAGNTYTKVIGTFVAGDNYVQEVWLAKNCLGSATNVVTVTWSAAVDFRAMVVAQYSGCSTTNPVADAKSQNVGPQPYTTPTLTIPSASYVSIIQSRWGFGGRTFPSGFNQFATGGAGAPEVADKIGTDGPTTTTYTITPGNFFIIGVILVATPGTPATLPTPTNYWPMNEGSGGTTFDVTGNKNSTVDEALSDWVPGKFSFGLSALSRASGTIGLFSAIDLGTTHSIALWMKWTSGGIVIGGNATGHYGLFVNAPDILYSAGSGNFVSVSYTVDTNWHHYAITRSGASVKFYVDGIQKGTTQTLGTPATTLILNSFGSYGFNPFDFPTVGIIDDVRLYNSELTASQVTTLYNFDPSAPITSPVVPYITIIDYDRAFSMVANQTYAMPSRIVSGSILGLFGNTDLQTSLDGTTWTTFTTLGAGTQASIRFIPQTPFVRVTQNAIISLNRRKGLGRQILNANNG